MKKSILFKKLGIILLISQTLVGVPMLAQESILETTVQTETESVTTETSQTVANLESETTSQTVMQEKESSSAIAESSSRNVVAVTTETTNEIQNSDTDGKAVSTENAFSEADYKQATALELATLVREKKVTSEELVKIALAITKRENPTLNAVITLREEAALTEAKALQDTGQPFLGVPLLLKGLGQSLKGESNTNGFGFLRDQVAGGTSTFVKALQNAGFIIIGQTNYPELVGRIFQIQSYMAFPSIHGILTIIQVVLQAERVLVSPRHLFPLLLEVMLVALSASLLLGQAP